MSKKMKIKDEMRQSYVAFIDVLGFKNLVYNADTEKLQRFFDIALEEIESQTEGNMNIESTIISDSIVLISPKDKDSFIKLINAIQNIQTRFIMEDIWIRGAVSFGKTCFLKDKNIVLGEGLISAYLLEKQAKYPRVIIDSRIINIIGTDSSNFLDIVNGTILDNKIELIHPVRIGFENDSYFVDYAQKLIIDGIQGDTLEKIYYIIKNNMYKEHAYFSKYLWVKNYLTDAANKQLLHYILPEIKERDYVNDFYKWRNKCRDM